MDSRFRIFCPEQDKRKEKCENCEKTSGPLGHEINKRYLKSISKICLYAECCDR